MPRPSSSFPRTRESMDGGTIRSKCSVSMDPRFREDDGRKREATPPAWLAGDEVAAGDARDPGLRGETIWGGDSTSRGRSLKGPAHMSRLCSGSAGIVPSETAGAGSCWNRDSRRRPFGLKRSRFRPGLMSCLDGEKFTGPALLGFGRVCRSLHGPARRPTPRTGHGTAYLSCDPKPLRMCCRGGSKE